LFAKNFTYTVLLLGCSLEMFLAKAIEGTYPSLKKSKEIIMITAVAQTYSAAQDSSKNE